MQKSNLSNILIKMLEDRLSLKDVMLCLTHPAAEGRHFKQRTFVLSTFDFENDEETEMMFARTP